MSSLTPNGGSAISFDYAGPGQAQRITMGSTDIVNNILGVASQTTGSTADYFTRDAAKAFVSQRRPTASAPNRRIYPLVDRLGSTRTLTDEAGSVVRRYAYQPYGDPVAVSGTWTASTPIRFASGELDGTGLYHFGQRYYDPTAARWTQQDPLLLRADMRQANRYIYVGGDPTNSTDRTGLFLGIDTWSPEEFLGLGVDSGIGAATCAIGAAAASAAPPVGAAVALGCGFLTVAGIATGVEDALDDDASWWPAE